MKRLALRFVSGMVLIGILFGLSSCVVVIDTKDNLGC